MPIKLKDARYERGITEAQVVVAAIILWNTIYLARAVETIRTAGADIADGILQRVWPLECDHIILTADDRSSPDNPKSLDLLRPLRLDRLPARPNPLRGIPNLSTKPTCEASALPPLLFSRRANDSAV